MDAILNFVLTIYKDITDGSKTILKRFYLVIFIFIGIYLIDTSFGFSYYLNISNKLEKTKEINEILKDSQFLSSNEISHLKSMRVNIIERKTIKEDVYHFFSNMSFKSKTVETTTKTTPKNNSIIIKKNYTIHYLTSSASILLVMFIMIFVGLGDKISPIHQRFIIISLVNLFLYPFTLLFSTLFDFIPILFSKPLINYILNFLLSFIIPISLYYFGFYLARRQKKIIY